MNVDEIKKAIETERLAIVDQMTLRRKRIAELYALIKDDQAALDALPRLAVKRTRKAKVATNG
jgi:dTDP-4-amino-4,6-dideoxygalactose transaminase